MRACFIVLAAASGSNLAFAGTVSDHSTPTTSVHGFQLGRGSDRFLRSYDMSDLNSSEEERTIGLAKLDDVINAAKLDDAVNAAKLDDVVNTAKLDDVDEAKINDLVKADTIDLALKDPDDEVALFAQWHASETLSNAILKRLQGNGNFLKNQKVIFRYNAYRTKLASFNKQLTPWLDTKTLDATLDSLQTHGMKKMTEQFEVWFVAGRTNQQITDALKPYPKLAKKYHVLEVHYEWFVKLQAINIRRAAVAKAKKAAEAIRAAEAKKAADVVTAI